MECHLSHLNQTKIDRAKNQQSFTSFVYKNANKNIQNQKVLTKCTANGLVGSLFSDVFFGYLSEEKSYHPPFWVGV
jgi:hypothetical protein